MTARTWVPGPGGYLIAAVIGWCLFAVAYLVPDLVGDGAWAALVIYLPLLVLVCATYGLPVTVAAIIVAGFLSRRVHALLTETITTGIVTGGLAAAWIHLTYPADLEPVDGPWSGHHLLVAIAVGLSAAGARVAAHTWLPRR